MSKTSALYQEVTEALEDSLQRLHERNSVMPEGEMKDHLKREIRDKSSEFFRLTGEHFDPA